MNIMGRDYIGTEDNSTAEEPFATLATSDSYTIPSNPNHHAHLRADGDGGFETAHQEILENRAKNPEEVVAYNFLTFLRNTADNLHYQTTQALAHHLATLSIAKGLYHTDEILKVIYTDNTSPALTTIISATIKSVDQEIQQTQPQESKVVLSTSEAQQKLLNFLKNFSKGENTKKLSEFLNDLANLCPEIKTQGLTTWLNTNELQSTIQTAFESYFKIELKKAVNQEYRNSFQTRANNYINLINWENSASISNNLQKFKTEINGNGIKNQEARTAIHIAYLQRFSKNPSESQRKLIYQIFNIEINQSTQFDLAKLISNPDGPNDSMLGQYRELLTSWESDNGITYEQSLQTLFQTNDPLAIIEQELEKYFSAASNSYQKIIKDYYGDNPPKEAIMPNQILHSKSFKELLSILCYPEQHFSKETSNLAQIRIFARIILEGTLAQRIIQCNEDVINREKYANLLMEQFFNRHITNPEDAVLKYNSQTLEPDENGDKSIKLIKFQIKGRTSLNDPTETTINVYAYNPGNTTKSPINIKTTESILAKIIKEGVMNPSLSDLLRMTLIVDPNDAETLKQILETITTAHGTSRHEADMRNKSKNKHSSEAFKNDYKLRPRIAVKLDDGQIVYPPSLEIQTFTPKSFIRATAPESPASHKKYKAAQGRAILAKLLPVEIFPSLYEMAIDGELNIINKLKNPPNITD